MIYNFKLIFRKLAKKPIISLISIFGLSVSMALVIILSIYCYNEFTTDHFHKNGEHIYWLFSEGGSHTPGIFKDIIDENIPQAEGSVRIADAWNVPVFQVDSNEPITSDLIFADKGFFDLFTYSFKEGNQETALNDPLSIVISSKLAQKLFGKKQAIGKIIKLDNKHELTVRAVINEQANSCIYFSALTNMETRKIIQPNEGEFANWDWSNFQTFLLLKKNSNSDELISNIKKLIPKESQERLAGLSLMPFKNIYFSDFSGYKRDYFKIGDKNKVILLTMVALLVLIITIFNFINISAFQWQEKIKQTEILKVNGARNLMIFNNVLIETSLLFFISLIISHFLIFISVSYLEQYTGILFNIQIIGSFKYIFIAIGATLILSFLCGIFPAIQITSFASVFSRKNNTKPFSTTTFYRGVLVTIQFVVAIVLIGFTLLVQKQVNFGTSNLGFNQENIIGIKVTPQLSEKLDVLENKLSQQSYVKDITFTQFYPGKAMSSWEVILYLGAEEKVIRFNTFSANAGFFELMDLKLSKGRIYSDETESDLRKVIVNKKLLSEYSISDPIGAKFGENSEYEIVGVVENFHYKPVNIPVEPLIIRNEKYASQCLVEFHSSDFKSLNKSIENIKEITAALSPSFPIEVNFFDQAIKNMYQSELLFRKTFSLFAICAIIICCLGILSLSLLSCQKRTKEIGVRKINGAKLYEIVQMLNKDFIKWVAIAFVISCPIAYYAMNKWLENFAYKTEMSWWVFALAGFIALFIALFTVSWQTWRAASRNPIEALRYE